MSALKIFHMSRGVYGDIVVVAENEDKARLLMQECLNYDPETNVEEYEIVDGLCIHGLGDS